jgi:diaminohydroxyphosphoribosylaminopyrimidine deaminase/5-amino-6-(5-phosphoribosylamino)uracil reductase
MVEASSDAAFMARALFLAERGRGTTSPNPRVGAVVVSADGVVVGQGAHERAGGPHAEVVALEHAGPRARGATLYCSLEPCAHTGRTGPCVERIVAAGITRVVAAMQDPNPRVSGAGFGFLRAHGVAVDQGLAEAEARALNAPFVTWITAGRPHVIAKVAVSADGFVGSTSGRLRLTSAGTDRFFHRQRAEVDAIAVGAGTVRADDPRLTARLAYRGRPLTRVVFDLDLEVRPTARLFSTLSAGPVIMIVRRQALEDGRAVTRALESAGAELVSFEGADLDDALAELGRREITSLLVEGGPVLHQAFFDAHLVGRVQRVVTPMVLGGGVPEAPGFLRSFEQARDAHERMFAADRLVEWDVHRTH